MNSKCLSLIILAGFALGNTSQPLYAADDHQSPMPIQKPFRTIKLDKDTQELITTKVFPATVLLALTSLALSRYFHSKTIKNYEELLHTHQKAVEELNSQLSHMKKHVFYFREGQHLSYENLIIKVRDNLKDIEELNKLVSNAQFSESFKEIKEISEKLKTNTSDIIKSIYEYIEKNQQKSSEILSLKPTLTKRTLKPYF